MHDITLVEPKLEDYWYEKILNEDKDTMSYNAGYDVDIEGYDYDTGIILYPKERWKVLYDRRKKEGSKFYYIKDNKSKEYVGSCNYNWSFPDKRYELGIVIKASKRGLGYSKEALILLLQDAFKNKIDKLYDNFELDRKSALNLFLSLGFKIEKKLKWKKFNKEVDGVLVSITKEDFLKSLDIKK